MDFLLPYTVIEFTTGQKWTKIDGTVKSCALLCNKYNDVISYKTITRHNFFQLDKKWTKIYGTKKLCLIMQVLRLQINMPMHT
jgi:hypothetical protein